MANVKRAVFKTLNETVEIKRVDNKWVGSNNNHELDQIQVRDIFKKISDSQIENYVFEGEP